LKIKAKNLRIVSLSIIVTIFILIMLIPGGVTSTEPNVLSVSHQPTTINHDTNITITATFADDENVTSVRILYCAIDPEYQCHIPQIDMIRTTANTWIGSFVVLEEIGTIGYQIHIDFNGGSIVAPNSSDYLGHDNIIETHTGIFYFSIVLAAVSETAPLNIGVPGIIVAYTIFVIVRNRKNKK
jgi:hypothetical protein